MPSAPERRIWRPYTQEKSALPPVPIVRAAGAYLFTGDGRRIFDGISSWWVITHGHCHPRIVEAIQKQTERLDQVIFANFTHEPAENLAEELIRRTPRKLSRAFFSDNGSTAVESALKMALQACSQRGLARKKKFVAFSKAYHGDTVGAMSVSGDGLFTRPYRAALFEILRANQPVMCGASAAEYLLDFQRLIEERHQDIAGVILEPLLQAAGGMIVWPREAIEKIAELCKQYGVFLIFDEVMTGFGRTGSLFAMDRLGVVPDLLCLSKGITGGSLPLAVTLASDEIYEAFLSMEKSRMFFHGHSFTGNPISCAAAVANLQTFASENAMERIRLIEDVNKQNLAKLSAELPISTPRTCGTMAAFELPTETGGYGSQVSEALTAFAMKQGVFLRPLGNVVYLLPPYCSTKDDLDFAWTTIATAVERLYS